jgi:hypothetical protein
VKPGQRYFAQVQINESLIFDLADDPERKQDSMNDGHHYDFTSAKRSLRRFSSGERQGLAYGSEPCAHTNGQIYSRRGDRGSYFQDPDGHLLNVMTVRETES